MHYTAEGMTGASDDKTQYITGDRQGHILITTINNGFVWNCIWKTTGPSLKKKELGKHPNGFNLLITA